MLTLTHQLETDEALLIPKARAALARYGHQLVIGNELHRRKHEVVFVERLGHTKGRGENLDGAITPPLMDGDAEPFHEHVFDEHWLRITEQDGEIEKFIIAELVKRHEEWIAKA